MLGEFLFWSNSKFVLLHVPKLCSFTCSFQNCFCFCCRTIPSHVGIFFRTLVDLAILRGKTASNEPNFKIGKRKKQTSNPPFWGDVGIKKWSPFFCFGTESAILELKNGHFWCEKIPTWEGMVLQQKQKQFWKLPAKLHNLGTCKVWQIQIFSIFLPIWRSK